MAIPREQSPDTSSVTSSRTEDDEMKEQWIKMLDSVKAKIMEHIDSFAIQNMDIHDELKRLKQCYEKAAVAYQSKLLRSDRRVIGCIQGHLDKNAQAQNFWPKPLVHEFNFDHIVLRGRDEVQRDAKKRFYFHDGVFPHEDDNMGLIQMISQAYTAKLESPGEKELLILACGAQGSAESWTRTSSLSGNQYPFPLIEFLIEMIFSYGGQRCLEQKRLDCVVKLSATEIKMDKKRYDVANKQCLEEKLESDGAATMDSWHQAVHVEWRRRIGKAVTESDDQEMLKGNRSHFIFRLTFVYQGDKTYSGTIRVVDFGKQGYYTGGVVAGYQEPGGQGAWDINCVSTLFKTLYKTRSREDDEGSESAQADQNEKCTDRKGETQMMLHDWLQAIYKKKIPTTIFIGVLKQESTLKSYRENYRFCHDLQKMLDLHQQYPPSSIYKSLGHRGKDTETCNAATDSTPVDDVGKKVPDTFLRDEDEQDYLRDEDEQDYLQNKDEQDHKLRDADDRDHKPVAEKIHKTFKEARDRGLASTRDDAARESSRDSSTTDVHKSIETEDCSRPSTKKMKAKKFVTEITLEDASGREEKINVMMEKGRTVGVNGEEVTVDEVEDWHEVVRKGVADAASYRLPWNKLYDSLNQDNPTEIGRSVVVVIDAKSQSHMGGQKHRTKLVDRWVKIFQEDSLTLQLCPEEEPQSNARPVQSLQQRSTSLPEQGQPAIETRSDPLSKLEAHLLNNKLSYKLKDCSPCYVVRPGKNVSENQPKLKPWEQPRTRHDDDRYWFGIEFPSQPENAVTCYEDWVLDRILIYIGEGEKKEQECQTWHQRMRLFLLTEEGERGDEHGRENADDGGDDSTS